MRRTRLFALLLWAFCALPATAAGFLHADGTRIVDGDDKPVLLRGMGLGGWMIQEGYMLHLGQHQQHIIRRDIATIVGPDKAAAFYRAWLDNFITKADVDAMAGWGFNSIRLPIHYDLLTLPADQEPEAGIDTWHEDGFRRIDALRDWARANAMYLILDLHAAPGGEGTDLPIADRDPAKPSLWESAENRRKTVALWKKLAARYADDPTIGAYDLLNETNWDFSGAGGGHGCKEKDSAPLRQLLVEITAAIRSVDTRHMIVIEGNCWGNNYAGVLPLWDSNMAISFHKYWNTNDESSIAAMLKLRDETHAPIWMGESGENSDAWFRDAIRLVEDHDIGWSFWPLKKLGFNNPLEVVPNPGWGPLAAYLRGDAGAPKPSADATWAALSTLANRDIRFENNLQHPEVIDAMFRQPHSASSLPFRPHPIGAGPMVIRAVDYDLGPEGVAYQDMLATDHHTAPGGDEGSGNSGQIYRNDGVDIAVGKDGPYVTDFRDGEWMAYTISAAKAGPRTIMLEANGKGTLTVSLNGGSPVRLALAGGGWATVKAPAFAFLKGNNRLVVAAIQCACKLARISVLPAAY
jgi:aryl-phospho-beta-D-glucosidase BglC (GH1 family)